MARRKDHTRPELKDFIRREAEKIIKTKGFDHLTARALAARIGYSSGTIYNIYPDMEALKQDINFHTLKSLYDACCAVLESSLQGQAKLQSLAYTYLDFAQKNKPLWSLLFLNERTGTSSEALSKDYKELLSKIFSLIENALSENMPHGERERSRTARLLWACLHGITVLTLDGRLKLVGEIDSQNLIEQLIAPFLETKGASNKHKP